MMKSKSLVIGIILLFVGTSNITTIAENTVDLENEKVTACTGFIYGDVGNSHGMFTWSPYPFALVTNGIKWVRCGLLGQYSMRLSLYHDYNITAHVIGSKPLTKHVYLTEEEPNRKITFDMYGSGTKDIKQDENPKPKIYGMIFGITISTFDHAPFCVQRASISIENRTKISGWIYGFYMFCFLEIGKPYTILVEKEGYRPLTETFTLTSQRPIQHLNLCMVMD